MSNNNKTNGIPASKEDAAIASSKPVAMKRRATRSSSEPSPATQAKKPRVRSFSMTTSAMVETNSGMENGNNEGEPAPFVDPTDYLDLTPFHRKGSTASPLPEPLTEKERLELESVLEFHIRVDGETDDWREDWSGNLAYYDKEISNPRSSRDKKSFKQSLILWAENVPVCTRLAYNLLRYVYHLKQVPRSARNILAQADPSSIESIEKIIRRVSYDPVVLRDDGWTTTRSDQKEGATGGAFLIGARIRYQDSDAVVLAYVHDADIGDLWKAYWIHEKLTFDLEAEEVIEAKRKWERRYTKATADVAYSRRSSRFAGSTDFSIAGIEHGIVLAASYSKGARPGVYWPARVMHASEITTQTKRSSATRSKVDVVFLAPYWSEDSSLISSRGRKSEALSGSKNMVFESHTLFHIETVDASADMIKEYPYGGKKGRIDLAELKIAFRFTGLPKPAFSRYLDSHRLAMGLKTFAKDNVKSEFTAADLASAGLFESHIMSLQTPLFPPVVLHLPFVFILSQLKSHGEGHHHGNGFGHEDEEPVLQLKQIVDAMKPPYSWGVDDTKSVAESLPSSKRSTAANSPDLTDKEAPSSLENSSEQLVQELYATVAANLPHLVASMNKQDSAVVALKKAFGHFLSTVVDLPAADTNMNDGDPSRSERNKKRKALLQAWTNVKRLGLETLASLPESGELLAEWRVALERVYRHIVIGCSVETEGDGVSAVLSDHRCNGHQTPNGCFERPVRLPAAIKGAKRAGAGSKHIGLFTQVNAEDLDRIETKVLPMAHTRSYLQRMKRRCETAKSENESLVLTDDSDGNGGEDTRGSKGTWKASVAAVATAVAGAEMLLRGECVNAFCITRPPGHHAGRSLHCMKAVSNGFCILNPAACVALYATTPIVEGGLGLSRVCVIDFDVHHGNGTQDILCGTYDPRFLYVSIHAGGANVNGVTCQEDDPNHELHDLANNPKQSGIYPGRCGDTSPHEGVLNLPLGAKVTAHEVGLALVSRVTPRVNQFAPDLIILSAGFDAHKNDPMGLGALASEDFGSITDVACQLAFKSCSGRVLSILEGGYGVPCCRPQLTLPATPATVNHTSNDDAPLPSQTLASGPSPELRPQPSKLLELGDELPDEMDDQVPYTLQRRLEKCHAEGFIDCVCEHVRSLARCNKLKR